MANKCFLLWNITKDITLKQTPNWVAVAKTSIATNESYKDKDWNKVDNTTFHNLVAFWHTANHLNKWFQKWSKALIEWKISNRTYDKPDWTKWYVSEVIIEKIEFAWWKVEPKQETGIIESDEDFMKKAKMEQDELSIEDIPF
jgi:single-strand DNA-binding protein